MEVDMRLNARLPHRILLVAGLVAGALAGPLSAGAAADDGGRPLSAEMTGAAEVPGPGDPDGSGTASLRVNPGQGEICYMLTVTNVDAVTVAHIHKAPAGSAAPPLVTLAAPVGGSSSGCATVDREVALAILDEPEAYYVNVHSAAHPGGAVRGQLHA
jgi:hypothetical protein